MDQFIQDTLALLDKANDDNRPEVLRRAFNRVKATNTLFDAQPFDAGDGRKRVSGRTAEGASLILMGEAREGDLLDNGGVSYYVENIFKPAEAIAAAQQRLPLTGGSAKANAKA